MPAEMPANWPPAALEAQAVAARSYALAQLARRDAHFDLYADRRSQVYGGIAAETPATTAAVAATQGQVVSTTARSRTRSSSRAPAADRFGARGDRDADPVPRLGPRSLRHALALPRLGAGAVRRDEAAQGAAALRPDRRLRRRSTDRPAACETLALTSADDSEVTLTGSQVRGRARPAARPGSRRRCSSCSRTARRMTYGGAVSLTGLAARHDRRGARSQTVRPRLGRGRGVAPDLDGRVHAIVKPRVTTAYRLAWGNVRAGLAKVTVTARVSAALTPSGIAGPFAPSTRGSRRAAAAAGRRVVGHAVVHDDRRVVELVLRRRTRTRDVSHSCDAGRRRCHRPLRAAHGVVRRIAALVVLVALAVPALAAAFAEHRAARRAAVVPRRTTRPGTTGRRSRSSLR